jgi:hypothetical protein
MDTAGNAFVIWADIRDDQYGVYARARSATGVLGPVLTLTADIIPYAVAVALGPNGRALFVWEDIDGRLEARFGSLARRLDPLRFSTMLTFGRNRLRSR